MDRPACRLRCGRASAPELAGDLPPMRGRGRPSAWTAHVVGRRVPMRKRGVGTRGVTAKVRLPVELTSLYDDLNAARLEPHTRVLSFAVAEASDATAHALSIPERVAVYAIERLRFTGDTPLALMRNEVPAAVVTLTKDDLESRSLYEILRSHGAAPRIGSE